MLKTFDLSFCDRIDYANENVFIDLARKKYGLPVIETLYEKGESEDAIRIWADLSRTDAPLCAALYALVKENSPVELETCEALPPEIRTLAGRIKYSYSLCFFIEANELENTRLYLYDYADTINGRL